MVLLGGDLFHDNKPSRKTLHQCVVDCLTWDMPDLFLLASWDVGNGRTGRFDADIHPLIGRSAF